MRSLSVKLSKKDRDAMKVVEIVAEWQEWEKETIKKRLSPNTLKTYAIHLGVFLKAHEGLTLSEMTPRCLRLHLAGVELRSGHMAHGCRAAFKRFCIWGVRQGYLVADVSAGLEVSPLIRNRREMAQDEGIRALFAACDMEPKARAEMRGWLAVMVYGGLRVSECVAMLASDVDMETGKVTIRRGKGGKGRYVWVCAECLLALRPLMRGKEADARIFTPTSTGALASRLRRLCELLGIEKITPHQLRHAYASRLLANGVDIETVRKLMGHSKLSTTSIYLHTTDERMINAAKSASLSALPGTTSPKQKSPSAQETVKRSVRRAIRR